MTSTTIWLLLLSFGAGAIAGNIYTARSALRYIKKREEWSQELIFLFIRVAKDIGAEAAFVAKANEHLAAAGMGLVLVKKTGVKDENSSS